LYLNVVRPAGYENTKLPVAFWIHGGGYVEGGGVDQRYNLSFMVQNSVSIGKPIIGVSINYRLSTWGFLFSREMTGSGNTNLGLRDQRLALHYLQENIAGFGGTYFAIILQTVC
jgi:carboxylesterase type B